MEFFVDLIQGLLTLILFVGGITVSLLIVCTPFYVVYRAIGLFWGILFGIGEVTVKVVNSEAGAPLGKALLGLAIGLWSAKKVIAAKSDAEREFHRKDMVEATNVMKEANEELKHLIS